MTCCNQCGGSPCFCTPRCSEDCPDVLAYTASNINLAGVGVFNGLVSQEFQFRGIRSTNTSYLTATLNNTLHTIDLEFLSSAFSPTTTFTNAATRANTIPAFTGQIGVQLDTNTLYMATSTIAGQWFNQWLFLEGQALVTNNPNSSLDFSGGGQLTFLGDLALAITYQSLQVDFKNTSIQVKNSSSFGCDSTVTADFDGLANFDGLVNFSATSEIQASGVTVPANDILVISPGTAGRLDSRPTTDFISIDNTSTYGVPTGTLTRTTFATGTVTLPQLAERVAALIVDLQSRLLPQP